MRRHPESRIILATSSALSLTAVPEKAPAPSEGHQRSPGIQTGPLEHEPSGPGSPFSHPGSVSTAHSRILFSSLEIPVTPPHCSVGIKEIGGVEPFSRIRHGQCSLDWTPPEGRAGGLNRAGIWWRCAPGERLSAFIATLFGDAAAGCPGSPSYSVEWD